MTQPLTLIGLVGRAGAGKTTVAEYLESQWSFDGFAFADPLKAMLAALFDDAGVPDAYLTERVLKEQPTTLGFSYRHLMQTLGTEWGRDTLAPSFWLRIAQMKLDEARRQGAHVVISDVRYENEVEFIHRNGGHLIEITRDSDELQPVRSHSSEVPPVLYGAVDEISNNGSLASLYDQVDALLHEYRAAYGIAP